MYCTYFNQVQEMTEDEQQRLLEQFTAEMLITVMLRTMGVPVLLAGGPPPCSIDRLMAAAEPTPVRFSKRI